MINARFMADTETTPIKAVFGCFYPERKLIYTGDR
jgi:hypothetical protein